MRILRDLTRASRGTQTLRRTTPSIGDRPVQVQEQVFIPSTRNYSTATAVECLGILRYRARQRIPAADINPTPTPWVAIGSTAVFLSYPLPGSRPARISAIAVICGRIRHSSTWGCHWPRQTLLTVSFHVLAQKPQNCRTCCLSHFAVTPSQVPAMLDRETKRTSYPLTAGARTNKLNPESHPVRLTNSATTARPRSDMTSSSSPNTPQSTGPFLSPSNSYR